MSSEKTKGPDVLAVGFDFYRVSHDDVGAMACNTKTLVKMLANRGAGKILYRHEDRPTLHTVSTKTLGTKIC